MGWFVIAVVVVRLLGPIIVGLSVAAWLEESVLVWHAAWWASVNSS